MSETLQNQPRKTITAEEFIDIWKGKYKGEKGYERFYQKDWRGDKVVFDNYAVSGVIKIKKEENLLPLQLNNSKLGPVSIVSSVVGDISIKKSSIGALGVINSNVKVLDIVDKSVTSNFNFANSYADLFNVSDSVIENISISNTKIKRGKIYRSKTKDFYVENDSNIGIKITSNSDVGSFTINNSAVTYFEIDKFSSGGDFEISNSTTGYLKISENSTTGYLKISENSIAANIDVSKSTISFISISDSQAANISIKDSSKYRYFNAYISTTGEINVMNSIGGPLSIDDQSKTGNIKIEDSHIGVLKVTQAIIEDLGVTNSATGDIDIRASYLRDFLFDKSSAENIQLNNTEVADLTLSFLKKTCKTLTVKAGHINTLRLKLDHPYLLSFIENENNIRPSLSYLDMNRSIFPKNSNLQIDNAYITKVTFDYFINYGAIYLYNLQPLLPKVNIIDSGIFYSFPTPIDVENVKKMLPAINIANSDMGNTHFIGCNLAAFEKFDFENSNLLRVFMAGNKLPHNHRICAGIKEENIRLNQKRLLLGQFKKIFEKRGDLVTAGMYRAEELEEYRKQLKADPE